MNFIQFNNNESLNSQQMIQDLKLIFINSTLILLIINLNYDFFRKIKRLDNRLITSLTQKIIKCCKLDWKERLESLLIFRMN